MQLCVFAISKLVRLQSAGIRKSNVRRKRHQDVIEWALFLNLQNHITYRHMLGDKDSYELAFALADKLENFSKIKSWSRTALAPLEKVCNLVLTPIGRMIERLLCEMSA